MKHAFIAPSQDRMIPYSTTPAILRTGFNTLAAAAVGFSDCYKNKIPVKEGSF